MSWESYTVSTCRQWSTPSLGVNSWSSLEFSFKARTTGRGLASLVSWCLQMYSPLLHIAGSSALRGTWAELAVVIEKVTTRAVGGDKTLLFVNGTDVSTIVQSMRHTDFRFLSFRTTSYISYLLGDNLTSRISDREDSAVAKKISQHNIDQRKGAVWLHRLMTQLLSCPEDHPRLLR